VALFRLLYGSGATGLALTLDVPVAVAQQIKDAIFAALPGVKGLDEELKAYARAGLPFYTLGGREYYCEPDSFIKGKRMSWNYKMLNTLIQGSSADQTKAAMLKYDAARRNGIFLITVHDELLLSVPEEHAHTEAAILTDSMQNAMPMDVPIIAEVKAGVNFASMKGMN
jgi:DNA polymerase-1